MSICGKGAALVLVCSCFVSGGGCIAQRPIHYVIETRYAAGDPDFRQTIGNLLGPPLIGGNRVQTLVNGDQIFPAMLEAIHSARKNIDFETFIYWSGTVGKEFADAFAERAAAGVKVHIILDWVGADYIDPHYLEQMKGAGVQIVQYHALHWYNLYRSASRLNNRTHRKLLIVDGTIGFTGGVGIADDWMGNADSVDHWRDNHYRVEGPVVAQLQASFLDNWIKTTGEILHGADYFPPLNPVGDQYAQVFKSGVQAGSESMELLFLLSVASARHNIRISNAYFVPDDLTTQSLIDARKRGVQVQVIVPGPHIDQKIVAPASQAKLGPLLLAGVEVYTYEPTMYHCKLLVVDDVWTSVGSANFDDRSFRLNDEANLNVLDRDFAARQIQLFDQDLTRAKKIDYNQWRHRSLMERLFEPLSMLLAPLL
jgi:cardiolipin synthase A/B